MLVEVIISNWTFVLFHHLNSNIFLVPTQLSNAVPIWQGVTRKTINYITLMCLSGELLVLQIITMWVIVGPILNKSSQNLDPKI